MTGIIIAACAAILLAGAGPLWQWHRARRTVAGRSTALQRLGRRVPDPASGHRPVGGASPPPEQPGRWAAPPPPPPASDSPYRLAGRRGASGLRWLPVSGVVMTLGIVAAVLALTVGRTGGHRYTPTADARPGNARATASPSTTPTTSPAATTPTTAPTSTTSAPPTTTAAPASGGPVLSSVSPAAAGPGQTVTLSGSNLFSSSGRIVVMFGSTQGGVSCPSQTTCQATVPALTGQPSPTSVSITTDSGTSAPLAFTYR